MGSQGLSSCGRGRSLAPTPEVRCLAGNHACSPAVQAVKVTSAFRVLSGPLALRADAPWLGNREKPSAPAGGAGEPAPQGIDACSGTKSTLYRRFFHLYPARALAHATKRQGREQAKGVPSAAPAKGTATEARADRAVGPYIYRRDGRSCPPLRLCNRHSARPLDREVEVVDLAQFANGDQAPSWGAEASPVGVKPSADVGEFEPLGMPNHHI